jgi:hypothetical protein
MTLKKTSLNQEMEIKLTSKNLDQVMAQINVQSKKEVVKESLEVVRCLNPKKFIILQIKK